MRAAIFLLTAARATVLGSPTTIAVRRGPTVQSRKSKQAVGAVFLLLGFVLLGAAPAAAVCGDGILDAGEQCDDGNTVAGDCCSPTCTFEAASTFCRPSVSVCDVA